MGLVQAAHICKYRLFASLYFCPAFSYKTVFLHLYGPPVRAGQTTCPACLKPCSLMANVKDDRNNKKQNARLTIWLFIKICFADGR